VLEPVAVGVIVVCWATVALVWLAGGLYNAARSNRSTVRGRSSVASSLVAVVVAAAALLAARVVVGGIVIAAPWARFVGAVVLLGSTGFALWARGTLGTSWTIGPKVTGDGNLRTTGPYGITRHPIYTGLLGMLAGSAVLAGGGEWLAVIGPAIVAAIAKVRLEEELLLDVFPEGYRRYAASVPGLVPGMAILRRRLRRA
jgi:protein-S-isoprenylcysteine O-methyltransferase Ste14